MAEDAEQSVPAMAVKIIEQRLKEERRKAEETTALPVSFRWLSV